jgi:HlyD family secretion protein
MNPHITGSSSIPPLDLDLIANPKRDIRQGLIIAAIFFVGFVGWAAFARLDAAAHATGNLIVSGQRQSVQHRDGGVVADIYIREGQRVERGQLLMNLAAAEVEAQERAFASQAIRLLALRARLEAEQLGASQIAEPEEFNSLPSADKAEAALAMKLQQIELRARLVVLHSQRGALRERSAQSGDQGRGYSEQVNSTREQLRLIDEQIAALKPVAENGFVSQTRIRELERMRAVLAGQLGQYAANVAQTRGAGRENAMQMQEAEGSFKERSASELHDIELRLGDILPKWHASRDQLARTQIRAPATGAVVGLSVFTPGGVISPGQKLLDIVPEKQPLRVQMQISPDDADDLVIGQQLLVKFSGLHERTLPNIEGSLNRLSADSFTDERTGRTYFTAEAEVPSSRLQSIQELRGKDFSLRAGMPVEVLIPLRKRTALDYALEPLIGSFWSSFREH